MDDDSADSADHEPLEEWSNWSENLTFEPEGVARPETEREVQKLVRECAEAGRTVRVVGSGHSWTPVVETDDQLVSLERMTGVVDHDPDTREATILGGTTLQELGPELQERHLAFPNLGDVSLQTIAGAFGTGTHGTGAGFENLSARLVGGRLVTADGEIREFSAESDPELLRAAQVSLGTLGIFTEFRLDLVPTYKVERREYCTTFADAREHVPRLVEENRNFDFYWYPRSDEVKLRMLNAPGGGTAEDDVPGTLVEKDTGWWFQTIPEHNQMTREFEEMEYAVPAEVGMDCFEEVRERVRERWRADVGWRLLWRTVASDDAYLSTEYDRQTVTISLLQNAQLEFWEYFRDVEPIFHEYDGRPHWGKRHTLRADELENRYPEWDRFQEIRRELDPDGVFMSDYLDELLEGDE